MLKNIIERTVVKGELSENEKREKLSVTAGAVGIVLNIILCIFKFFVGTLTHSVSITADAINNLSDAGSNVVSIVGAKLSNKPVDKEHPFGHGRMEYISALVVAFLIFLMGFELAKSSVEKILNPTEITFSAGYVVVLVAAIGIKLWMGYFNHVMFKMTENINLKAVKKDCINDSISTAATLGALVISHFTGFKMADGIIGLGVSVIIALAGVEIVKDIMGPLLGQPPSKEVVDEIERIIVSQNPIIGIHDLIVHDYGPGRRIASVHAEVPSDVDIVEIHDLIDNVEVQILQEMGIIMCIHLDPLVLGDETVNKYKQMTHEIIKGYNAEYTFHDFRVVEGPTHTNLLFDIVIPAEKSHVPSGVVLKDIQKLFKEKDSTINIVARVEHPFV